MQQHEKETAVRKSTHTLHVHLDRLPEHGKARWRQIKPFIPISREKFRQLELQGKAPRRERMGVRCTYFDLMEVNKWLRDPLNYRAPDAQ